MRYKIIDISEEEIDKAMKKHFGGRMNQEWDTSSFPKTGIQNDLLDALRFFKGWIKKQSNVLTDE